MFRNSEVRWFMLLVKPSGLSGGNEWRLICHDSNALTRLRSFGRFLNIENGHWFKIMFWCPFDAQDQWKRGQPVLVGNVHKVLTDGIWHPEAFCEEFGHIKNDLVNCRNGHIMHAVPMTTFWIGFANMDVRLVDKFQTPLVLKLKVSLVAESHTLIWPEKNDSFHLILRNASEE